MQLIAHRGLSSEAPENTLAAFDLALQCGARAVECDLQRTRDGRLVVLHDGTLNRTTNGRGAVRFKTLAEAQSLSAGYPKKFGSGFANERIPTFETLLQRLRHRAHLYAEIKREAVSTDGSDRREMICCVRALSMVQQVTFISFEWSAIEAMRLMDPDIHLGLLFDRYRPRRKMLALAEAIDASFLMGRADLVEKHPDLVDEAHHCRLKLGVYTVDSLHRLTHLQQLGVDAAATNRIGEFLNTFQRTQDTA
jgi:glycerophosphoryl diester phosphodiesterase